MNFFNKKLVVQVLVVSSMFGGGIGYNLRFAEPIAVSALNTDSISAMSALTEVQELDVKSIKCNYRSTVFLKNDGTVWSTGSNGNGELGIGNTANQYSPVQVPITDVQEIVCGAYHTVLKKNDGTIWAMGYNGSGQLGIGNTVNQIKPVQIPINNVKKIVCGGCHIMFIKNDGTVWCIGDNSQGQLGIGNTTNQTTPVQVPITHVQEIVCGWNHTIFKKDDGTVWGCGQNNVGQLGIGNAANQVSPVQVSINNVKNIACGYHHTVFLKNDGTTWATGYNHVAELGIGNYSNQLTPVQVPITNVEKIVCGGYNTMFIKNDGTVWANGYNASAQLGIGNYINQITPVKVPITNIEEITASSDHTIFQKDNGTIWGNGYNVDGELGTRTIENKTLPSVLDSLWFHKTNYTLDTIYNNLSDFSSNGSLSTTLYGNSKYDNKSVGYKNESTASLGQNILENTELRLKEVLPNGSVITVDNYGAIQFYPSLTSAATKIAVDGKTIDSIHYGMLNHTFVVMFYDADGTVWCLNPADTSLTLKMLPITQSEFTKTSVYQNKNAAADILLFERVNGDLVYFDINRAENSTGINSKLVSKVIPATTNNSTLYLMVDGTLKYIDEYGKAADVSLPTGSTVQAVLSNRFVKMSDGFVYGINNNALVVTKILANDINSAINNVLWANNGTVQTLNTGGKVATLSGINSKSIKQIIPIDNNNAYILNNDGTTYGVGNLVETTDLKDFGIDYNDIVGFISNNDNSIDNKLLVMKDGTVYTNPSNWTKSTQIHVVEKALSKIKQISEVSFNAVVEATDAVILAEVSKSQADIDKAKALVSALKDEVEKAALQARLDAAQTKANADAANAKVIEIATSAVVKAEISKAQPDVDAAKSLVSALPAVADKITLQARLDALQAKINAAAVQSITDATNAVVKAETSKAQVDVDAAKLLVNALTDGTDKASLQARLDKVQAAIDEQKKDNADSLAIATNSVVKAEASNLQADVDTSKILVNALTTGTNRTGLLERLNAVQNIINAQIANKQALTTATSAVVKAETSKLQIYLDKATGLVTALADGTDKISLQARLEAVQVEIKKIKASIAELPEEEALANAQNAVVLAESSKLQADVYAAEVLVTELPEGTDKTSLQGRIDKVQEAIDLVTITNNSEALTSATNAVVAAETNKTQVYVNAAKVLVDALSDGEDKTGLQSRLQAVQTVIDKAKIITGV